jgi:hypothetical protein
VLDARSGAVLAEISRVGHLTVSSFDGVVRLPVRWHGNNLGVRYVHLDVLFWADHLRQSWTLMRTRLRRAIL